jgi:hypothetical protein
MGASSPEIELQFEPIKNRKMKTRCFDHIDLRVKKHRRGRKVLLKIFAAAWIC